jgi:hypothetical protein
MKVRNLENNEGIAQRNQFVIENDHQTVFQSYNSAVCRIDVDGITFGRDWDYSNTTGKHLHRFLSEYGLPNIHKNDIENAIKNGYFYQRPDRKVFYDPNMK